jgi:hypothetical protein
MKLNENVDGLRKTFDAWDATFEVTFAYARGNPGP